MNEQWAAIKGYLRIEPTLELDNKYAANWYYDPDDPDETTEVLNLKKVILIADENGNPIPEAKTAEPSVSTAYDDLGREKPAEIRAYVSMARKRAKAPIPLASGGVPRASRSGSARG